jgi:hypothetical protein
MSSKYLQTKGKKLRRRSTENKGPPLSKSEALFKKAESDGLSLHESLREEKNYRLLRRVVDGRLSQATAEHLAALPPERVVYGNVDSVFKASSPLKYMLSLKHISLCDNSLTKSRFVGMRSGSNVILINEAGKVLRYSASKWVYAELIKIEQLPADLRKWDPLWSKMFIKLQLLDIQASNKGRKLPMVSSDVNKLHQIRKINHSPGKKQLAAQQKIKEVYDMDEVVNPTAVPDLFSY